MKKITLCIAILLTVLCGVAQADIITRQEVIEMVRMKISPVERKIERCKELNKELNSPDNIGGGAERQWLALNCDKLLGKTQETMPNSNDGENTAEKHEKTEIRIYGFIGLGVLLICALAFGLLLKTRNKKLPHVS